MLLTSPFSTKQLLPNTPMKAMTKDFSPPSLGTLLSNGHPNEDMNE